MNTMNIKELDMKEMEPFSGGYIYLNDKGQFEVLDDKNGSVIASFENREDAAAYCNQHGLNTRRINWTSVDFLRHPGRPLIDRPVIRRR